MIKNYFKLYQRIDDNICNWYHSAVGSYLKEAPLLLIFSVEQEKNMDIVQLDQYIMNLYIQKLNLFSWFHIHFIPTNLFFEAIAIYTMCESIFAFRDGNKGMCYFTEQSRNVVYVFFAM